MGLTLTIENETSLPDGGPLSVTVTGKRGLDIGRDTHLDWTLPDPTRFISGKHCEVRYRDGGYWLYDVSTNGTFLNGSEGRLKAPHRLRNGDRLTIGQYIVAVALDGEEGDVREAPPPSARPAAYHDLWNPTEDAAPPVDRKLLKPASANVPVRPDFLDWAIDVPDTEFGEPGRQPAAPPTRADDDLSWARGAQMQPPAPDPAPAMPTPRRPVWLTNEPSGPWGAGALSSEPAADPAAPAYAPPPAAAPSGPPPAAPARSGPAQMPDDFMRLLARGANVPEQTFAQDPQKLAEQLGLLLRLVTENLRQLLNARLQAKRLARMSNQTTIEALNNNPLKFSPSTEDALRIMFGPATASYLNAQQAIEESFGDLKEHQIRTYAAMQQALAMIVADLDPQAIENAAEADRGLTGMIGSRKARLWDAYVGRWQAKTRGQDGGLVDVFMQYFAECYDRGGARNR
jgi:type VI secretion system protein ImpI